jgi:hypothetical protein
MDATALAVVQVVLGALVLLFGRRLFWLFVAVVGFLLGMQITQQLMPDQSQTVVLIISAVLGIVGAILAVAVSRGIAAVAGFLAGGALAVQLLPQLGVSLGSNAWIAFVVGGIIGIVLILMLFDLSIILFSSLVGANLILQGAGHFIAIAAGTVTIALIVLVVVGIAFQIGLLQAAARPRTAS